MTKQVQTGHQRAVIDQVTFLLNDDPIHSSRSKLVSTSTLTTNNVTNYDSDPSAKSNHIEI
jgi:hypothetical protein